MPKLSTGCVALGVATALVVQSPTATALPSAVPYAHAIDAAVDSIQPPTFGGTHTSSQMNWDFRRCMTNADRIIAEGHLGPLKHRLKSQNLVASWGNNGMQICALSWLDPRSDYFKAAAAALGVAVLITIIGAIAGTYAADEAGVVNVPHLPPLPRF